MQYLDIGYSGDRSRIIKKMSRSASAKNTRAFHRLNKELSSNGNLLQIDIRGELKKAKKPKPNTKRLLSKRRVQESKRLRGRIA